MKKRFLSMLLLVITLLSIAIMPVSAAPYIVPLSQTTIDQDLSGAVSGASTFNFEEYAASHSTVEIVTLIQDNEMGEYYDMTDDHYYLYLYVFVPKEITLNKDNSFLNTVTFSYVYDTVSENGTVNYRPKYFNTYALKWKEVEPKDGAWQKTMPDGSSFVKMRMDLPSDCFDSNGKIYAITNLVLQDSSGAKEHYIAYQYQMYNDRPTGALQYDAMTLDIDHCSYLYHGDEDVQVNSIYFALDSEKVKEYMKDPNLWSDYLYGMRFQYREGTLVPILHGEDPDLLLQPLWRDYIATQIITYGTQTEILPNGLEIRDENNNVWLKIGINAPVLPGGVVGTFYKWNVINASIDQMSVGLCALPLFFTTYEDQTWVSSETLKQAMQNYGRVNPTSNEIATAFGFFDKINDHGFYYTSEFEAGYSKLLFESLEELKVDYKNKDNITVLTGLDPDAGWLARWWNSVFSNKQTTLKFSPIQKVTADLLYNAHGANPSSSAFLTRERQIADTLLVRQEDLPALRARFAELGENEDLWLFRFDTSKPVVCDAEILKHVTGNDPIEMQFKATVNHKVYLDFQVLELEFKNGLESPVIVMPVSMAPEDIMPSFPTVDGGTMEKNENKQINDAKENEWWEMIKKILKIILIVILALIILPPLIKFIKFVVRQVKKILPERKRRNDDDYDDTGEE